MDAEEWARTGLTQNQKSQFVDFLIHYTGKWEKSKTPQSDYDGITAWLEQNKDHCCDIRSIAPLPDGIDDFEKVKQPFQITAAEYAIGSAYYCKRVGSIDPNSMLPFTLMRVVKYTNKERGKIQKELEQALKAKLVKEGKLQPGEELPANQKPVAPIYKPFMEPHPSFRMAEPEKEGEKYLCQWQHGWPEEAYRVVPVPSCTRKEVSKDVLDSIVLDPYVCDRIPYLRSVSINGNLWATHVIDELFGTLSTKYEATS